jgi:hypothetical protein
LSHPVTPHFITPSEMIDVAESELLSHRNATILGVLPEGENAPSIANDQSEALLELDHWLALLGDIDGKSVDGTPAKPRPLQEVLLPASFAIASYRASLLPLIGDANESSLQGATAILARMPLEFTSKDKMQKVSDPYIAAMSIASLVPISAKSAVAAIVEATLEAKIEAPIEVGIATPESTPESRPESTPIPSSKRASKRKSNSASGYVASTSRTDETPATDKPAQPETPHD